jgi:hypothetical protein
VIAEPYEPTPDPEGLCVAEVVLLPVPDDGPKSNFGLCVNLLLMNDGTVRWEYEPS